MYEIDLNYVHRDEVAPHDDRSFTDGWQKATYATARMLCDRYQYKSVLDIGCGSAYKLVKDFSDMEITGTELEPTLSYLKHTYPQHKWILSDFNKTFEREYDIVICSDVIEHIKDPDELLRFIKRIRCKIIVLSTPDRELYGKEFMMGPPRNPCHFREWTYDELYRYLWGKFEIIGHVSNSDSGQHCQIVIMQNDWEEENKNIPWYELEAKKFIKKIRKRIEKEYPTFSPDVKKQIEDAAASDFYVYGKPEMKIKYDKESHEISSEIEIPRVRVAREYKITLFIEDKK